MKSKKPMRVNLFQVVRPEEMPDVEDVLSVINDSTLEERVRDLGYKLRLEEIQAPTAQAPYWLLDFSKLRYDGGPGRASAATPTTSFDLDEDEAFSEETAVLYCPQTGYAVVQYNHYGPRVGVISEYLSIFDHDRPSHFDFRIKLKDDAQARLDKKTIFTHLEMRVAPARLSQAFRKADMALSTMLDRQIHDFGGDYVTIAIGLESHSNNYLKLKNRMAAFFGLANNEIDAVDTLKISGKDSKDARTEVVDLIAEKLQLEYTGLQLDGGRRYLRSERWVALERAYLQWKKNGYLG